jgi:hypothetical protein
MGVTPSTSSEAKGEIRKQTIQLTINLSIIIFKFFEKNSRRNQRDVPLVLYLDSLFFRATGQKPAFFCPERT